MKFLDILLFNGLIWIQDKIKNSAGSLRLAILIIFCCTRYYITWSKRIGWRTLGVQKTQTFWICTASSRVGERHIACVSLSSMSTDCNKGMEIVTVLPVPDWAWAITCPLAIGFMARCWMAEGRSKSKQQKVSTYTCILYMWYVPNSQSRRDGGVRGDLSYAYMPRMRSFRRFIWSKPDRTSTPLLDSYWMRNKWSGSGHLCPVVRPLCELVSTTTSPECLFYFWWMSDDDPRRQMMSPVRFWIVLEISTF